ncbi:UNVERIFIED_CONTAM: Polyprotein P3 [Sesamum latifolium]|uniref:Polyprotein P3 n=1 Tax=Sesamum latifolium TaxID=2727402 RepID=A0AAW2X2C4_9LAMI
MRRQTTLAISCGKVLKVKAQTIVFTQVQSDDEDDRESVASSNYISNGTEEDFAQIYHVTLIEDGEIEEEDAEDAPVELEEGVKATVDELREVNLGNTENPRPIYTSASLTQEEDGAYITLLHEFKDVFAWSYKKMPGLDPKVAVHHLSVKKGARPVKQGQRRFRPELIPLIETEVIKLIEVGFIREVKYPMWISSIVPVRNKNGQIRVCVDFRDLNNACPKDDFPLPIAELIIDATTGHEALSFMDGSFGYNQIRMAPADEELTVFRTPKGIYCYKVIPFGLKNAGATYQRAMQRIFDDMLHKNVEYYVDDLVVKSKKREDHLYDLRKVFECLRRYQQKMNPSKCAFGVTSGKFLGFIVRQWGIEIEQAKIDAILRMPEPRNIHELKSLQGKLAYLRRFISNLAGRCQPFSHLMKKDVPFEWDEACDKAFKSIKFYLMKPPVLVAPVHGRPLILYVAAQERSVGILLAQKNDEGKENALYYLSRTMTPNELKYSPIEKLCLALIFAIQKLKHYFQSHSIHRVSKANPLKYVMTKSVLSDSLTRWYLQLQQFEIAYVPQKAIKGQVLADFLADHPMPAEWELSDDLPDEDVLVIEITPPWKMYFDGASHKEGAGAGVVFVTSEGEVLPLLLYIDLKLFK